MTDEHLNGEPFAALLERHRSYDAEPLEVHRVCLQDAVRHGDDPLHIIPYLNSLGIAVACLDDLLRVNADYTEEELHAFRVREGVAVSVASDGAWALFTP